jgi:hypothetical protein
MRDVLRISEFLVRFQELWTTIPDLRFMQIVTVIQIQAKEKFGIEDLYYVEDDKLMDIMQDIITNGEIN